MNQQQINSNPAQASSKAWGSGREATRAGGQRSKPFVIVFNPGEETEEIAGEYGSFAEAVKNLPGRGQKADVMRRLNDGTLTTEI